MLDYVCDPDAITRASFEIIEAECDVSGLPADIASIARRIVHACGEPDVFADLAWSEGAGEAGRRALAAGAPILCDARMVAAGIMAGKLSGNEVLVGLDRPEADRIAAEERTTRSAAGMAALRGRLGGSIVVIGNAPTALFRLLELVQEGTARPALVLGFPVGFVGAAESKAALAESGLPFVTLFGRRGGSAIAAAALNALILAGEAAGTPASQASQAAPASQAASAPHEASWTALGEGRLGALPSRLRAFLASVNPSDRASGPDVAPSVDEEAPHPASSKASPAPRPWLSVIGIGEDGLAGLSPAARALLHGAEILIGGARHLAMLPEDRRERHVWPSPLSALAERIPEMRGRPVAVLATGDPMCFGIGTTLARLVPAAEMTIIPAPSAFSLAAARLAWPLHATACLTLHGRPVELLALHVHPKARLLILAHDARTPHEVAAWLSARGFGDSRMISLAAMGGPSEARVEGRAADWRADVPDFHTLAVECVAGLGALWHSRTAGLPDAAFEHDGKMTKREFRALALAKLQPHAGALLWDVGAGCGSISIEWLRAAPGAEAVALEPIPERRASAARNALILGVPHLDVRDGRAPDALEDWPVPDAVFLGGGLSAETVALATDRLARGGRLVAHAVTLESEALLLNLSTRFGGDLTRLAVARADDIGAYRGWRPAMPVTQWAWVKP